MLRRLTPFLIAAVLVLLDRFTKGLIKTHFSAYDTFTVIPGLLNIVHTENPGIAFGMLANASGPWRDILLIGFSAVVLIAISVMLLRPGSQRDAVLRTALAFILGGAFGNLYDRIVNGTVTDFIEAHAGQHYFPAFNVADSAITVGACLLLLDMWRAKERESAMFPKLISIGSFFIPTYGTLVAIGFLAALWIIIRLAKRANLPPESVTNLGIYCALAGLAGAKLFMILFDFGDYWSGQQKLFSLATLQAAGVYQGGFLIAFITAILYMRSQHLPILATCDVFAPGIALGQAIGRIGCFSAGCCWGTATHVPWAITFRNPQAADLTGVPLGIPLHPTQLYESVADALIFGFLYFRIGKTHTAGAILGWYLALYSAARFLIEFFRFHEQGLHFGLSYTQWISLATLAAGVALLLLRRSSFIHPRESVSIATSPRT